MMLTSIETILTIIVIKQRKEWSKCIAMVMEKMMNSYEGDEKGCWQSMVMVMMMVTATERMLMA